MDDEYRQVLPLLAGRLIDGPKALSIHSIVPIEWVGLDRGALLFDLRLASPVQQLDALHNTAQTLTTCLLLNSFNV